MRVKDMQILFICDRKKCKRCNPDCMHTSDPEHAAHFMTDDRMREPVFVETTAVEKAYKRTMGEIINCTNCGQEVTADSIIRINTGRSSQCLCPKCYRHGSGEADARAWESKRVFFLKGEKSRGNRRR